MLRRALLHSRRAAPAGYAGVWNIAEALGLQKGPGSYEVCAIDPRTVLKPGELQAIDLESVANVLTVPRELVPKLSKGVSELADMDEPGIEWYFGERAEIFDYKLLGEHRTQSGFTSLIQRDVLERIRRGEVAKLPSWEQFLELTSDQVTWPHRKMPFLFAGRMVEASVAAVYALERKVEGHEGRVVTGVLISSESSGGASD
ncbi:hypothetical protein GPECTOR_78g84 [Gonium pectorale]|uniref:Uncharacterized protein n=1 Tax=Gonium pectorale TaxID=33097 RepID=A0A150G1Z8_GONPE|nr:hypothetical protein GPECTOR_78g84 [Gonium pectorale]|eukprot:KXZ43896.1 hypothetical protein GPECTOR_78g84 [Gonium pectorale]